MATGSENRRGQTVLGGRLSHGQYHIAKLVPSNLVIGTDTKITPMGETARRDARATSTGCSRAPTAIPTALSVIASKATPGRPVGRSIPRHARRRSERHRAARASPRVARLLRVRRLAQPRRCERDQLAVVADHGERPDLHPPLPARLRLGARQRRGRARAKDGKATRRSSKRAAKSASASSRSASRSRSGGRGVLRVASDRPPAEGPLELASRKVVAHITNAAFRHTRPTIVLGRAQARVDHRRDDRRGSGRRQVRRPARRRTSPRRSPTGALRILQTFLPKVNPVVDPAIVGKAGCRSAMRRPTRESPPRARATAPPGHVRQPHR